MLSVTVTLRIASSNTLLVSDSEFHIHAGVDCHCGNVLNNTEWGLEIDDALVNLHFETVPCLGTYASDWICKGKSKHTFAVGGFSCGDLQRFCRHTDRSLNVEVLFLSTGDKIVRNYEQTVQGR